MGNIEYARFKYHKDQVWEIQFVQRGLSNLLISLSMDKSIVVLSL